MTIKTLSDFKGQLETISFSNLAVALGCDESTIKIWLKDETINMPKPLQIGDNMWFSYKEVKNWLNDRPRFNCFYDVNTNKIEKLNKSKNSVEIGDLMNEKIALESLQQKFANLCMEQENLKSDFTFIQQSPQHSEASTGKTGIIMICIDNEIKLFSLINYVIEYDVLCRLTLVKDNCKINKKNGEKYQIKNRI